MILLYHKIDTENKTEWWVSADAFYRQLVQLSGKKVVCLDDYDPKNPDHVVITFDGIYSNVLRYAAPLLQQFGYPFELFVTGDTIGQDNEFDSVEPACKFAGKDELKQLVAMGGRLQWHTKTHRDITQLTDKEVEQEIVMPAGLRRLDPKGFKWFAYAYGRFDERSQKLVKKHYSGGLACDTGDVNDITILPRLIVTEDTRLIDTKVSVMVTSYNYAHFLVEAIESVLRQTYLPDEIILSDDASSDHSYEIMMTYQRQYPDLIKVNRNTKNMGIENHFNKVVKLSSGDIVGFLGADNRYQTTYVEGCVRTLLQNEKAAVAYTDFALFGNRAEYMHGQFYKDYQGETLVNGVYLIHFPEFDSKNRKVLLESRNFIHGSSMYRRKVWDQVGGYKPRTGTSDRSSEDYTLFQAMVKKGWQAQKVKGLYLEYRQHSMEQANQQFSYFSELAFLRNQFKDTEKIIAERNEAVKELAAHSIALQKALAELDDIKRSRLWKVGRRYRQAHKAVRHPRQALRFVKRRLQGPS